MEITKRGVKMLLGMQTDVELAALFGISRAAVGQWGDDEALPELRQLQLQVRLPHLLPDLFAGKYGTKTNKAA